MFLRDDIAGQLQKQIDTSLPELMRSALTDVLSNLK
jgi:hypothetical protein